MHELNKIHIIYEKFIKGKIFIKNMKIFQNIYKILNFLQNISEIIKILLNYEIFIKVDGASQ